MIALLSLGVAFTAAFAILVGLFLIGIVVTGAAVTALLLSGIARGRGIGAGRR